MKLRNQKRIAAGLLNVGKSRVWLDPQRLEEIKEAITKADLRTLIKTGAIKKKPETGISRYRTRKKIIQRRKGRRQGIGSRKGKRTARLRQKTEWMNKIRAQRKLLHSLKQKSMINNETFKELYKKSKGGYFRSRSHIMGYLRENELITNKDGKR